MSTSHPAPRWFKSSYSQGGEGDCIETAGLTDSVGVRDSKDLAVGQLAVEPAAWTALIGSIKSL